MSKYTSLGDVTMLWVTRVVRLDYKASKTWKKKFRVQRIYIGRPVRGKLTRKNELGICKLFNMCCPPCEWSSAKVSWWFAMKVVNEVISYIDNNNRNVLHMIVLIK